MSLGLWTESVRAAATVTVADTAPRTEPAPPAGLPALSMRALACETKSTIRMLPMLNALILHLKAPSPATLASSCTVTTRVLPTPLFTTGIRTSAAWIIAGARFYIKDAWCNRCIRCIMSWEIYQSGRFEDALLALGPNIYWCPRAAELQHLGATAFLRRP